MVGLGGFEPPISWVPGSYRLPSHAACLDLVSLLDLVGRTLTGLLADSPLLKHVGSSEHYYAFFTSIEERYAEDIRGHNEA